MTFEEYLLTLALDGFAGETIYTPSLSVEWAAVDIIKIEADMLTEEIIDKDEYLGDIGRYAVVYKDDQGFTQYDYFDTLEAVYDAFEVDESED